MYIKTDDIYKDIAKDVETTFDTSNYELDRRLPKGKSKKVIGLMKDELGGKGMTKFFGLKAKTYSNLTCDGSEDKKVKGTKMCVIKRKFKFENYKNCLEATQLENKINHLEKDKTNIDRIRKNHKEFVRSNKLISKTHALSSNDDDRMESFDSIETYAYGASKDIVNEKEKIKCNNIIKW